ncbi:MAG: hypothetical protein HY821_22710 [Acidobacteria bacterium]|nr:hypothetical protein [Acidobacteriota bacterium]
MLRALVICPDSRLAEMLDHALAAAQIVKVVRDFDHYPGELDFMRGVRANAPQVVFLSIESMVKAMDLLALIERETPGLQVVAVSRSVDSGLLLDVMRAGIREFLAPPFDAVAVSETLQRVVAAAEAKPVNMGATDQLYCFLPSKQGVGTSTVALNVALAISRQPEASTLLIDLDLSSGIIGFLLKLNNSHSVVEAAENAAALDESIWPQLVTRVEDLDVVHSGRLNPDFRIESSQLRAMLDFARRHYRTICVDLSGNLERYSLEIMHEAKRIFMVVTPEIPSLHLAREKLSFLNRLEMAGKVTVLLNRSNKRNLVTPGQIEDLLGAPVAHALSNDYQGVHRALQAGRGVDTASELGRQFTNLAGQIQMKKAKQTEIDTKKRFVEYFSLLPGRYTVADKKTAV